MKKTLFFILLIATLSGCYMERRMYTHYHSWNKMYHVHRYYAPRYIAPLKENRRNHF